MGDWVREESNLDRALTKRMYCRCTTHPLRQCWKHVRPKRYVLAARVAASCRLWCEMGLLHPVDTAMMIISRPTVR